MLPSLSAGTFEGGRPQIVFERGECQVVIEPKTLRLTVSSGCVSGSRAAAYDCARMLCAAGIGGWMPKVSAKQVQRRIADAQYTVAQPKRPGRFFRRGLALIILAIIAVATPDRSPCRPLIFLVPRAL